MKYTVEMIMIEDDKYRSLVDMSIELKESTEELCLEAVSAAVSNGRDLEDICSSLTESEKLLSIRYPVAALKVNTARNVAISKTREKFGYNGLEDSSDAFRHGIWNAAMVIRIGEEKAELFATAHEDKDTDGVESDGFTCPNRNDICTIFIPFSGQWETFVCLKWGEPHFRHYEKSY